MIKPTVGRVVWYYPAGKDHTDQPWAALIARVNSDYDINVAAFNERGELCSDTNVPLMQDPASYGSPGGGSCACWMPYQHGQAAKTEELEKRLA